MSAAGPEDPIAFGRGDQFAPSSSFFDRVREDEAKTLALKAHDQWERDTYHIRTWVNGQGAPSVPLRRQLAMALLNACDSDREAMAQLLMVMPPVPVKS